MSYAKFNIWIRELDCTPRNVWKLGLDIRTCGGKYLVDFNRDVIDKLSEAYPDYTVTRDIQDSTTIIKIVQKASHRTELIKHIEVPVPPGCYSVRGFVCWGNLWSYPVMVIVGCGQDACVNLLVPKKRNCIRNVAIPVGIAAYDVKLDLERLGVTLGVLAKLGEKTKEDLLGELGNIRRDLAQSDAVDAPELLAALKYTEDAISGIPNQEKAS